MINKDQFKSNAKKAGAATLKELSGLDWKAMADANGDGRVTIKEAWNFVKNNWLSVAWRVVSTFATVLGAIYYEVILNALTK